MGHGMLALGFSSSSCPKLCQTTGAFIDMRRVRPGSGPGPAPVNADLAAHGVEGAWCRIRSVVHKHGTLQALATACGATRQYESPDGRKVPKQHARRERKGKEGPSGCYL